MTRISFTDSRESRITALRIRRIYRNIIEILKAAKSRRARRAALISSKIANSEVYSLLPRTRVFVNLVGYHTVSGKFKKASYRVLLKTAYITLGELEPLIRDSQSILARSRKAKAMKKVLKFSTLEDLARVKQLEVAECDENEFIPRKKQVKTGTIDSSRANSGSVDDDDASVFKTLEKQSAEIDLDSEDPQLLRRGIILQKTTIPEQSWQKMHVEYGLQVVARQYITAMYGTVLAVPDTDTEFTHTEESAEAEAKKWLRRNAKRTGVEYDIAGRVFHVRNDSHWYFMLLPKHCTKSADFKMGTWDFAKRPTVSTGRVAIPA